MESYGVLANGQRVDLGQQPTTSMGQMAGGQPMQMNTGGPGIGTPQGYLNDTLQSNLQSVQTRFNTQWKTIQDNAKYLGPAKAEAMLQELQQNAMNEVAQIKQAATLRADTLQRLQQLGQQGQLGPDGERLMWETAAGKELAKSMFPDPVEAPDPLTLDAKFYDAEERLAKERAGYHVIPAQPAEANIGPGHVSSWLGLPGLAYGAITSKKGTPSTIEKWDPDAEDKVLNKQGVWVREIGKWVESSTPDKDRQLLAEKHKQLQTMRDARLRLGQPDFPTGTVSKLSAMMLTGENSTGTLDDKVNASVLNREVQQPKPKKLDRATAIAILREAKGDRELAKRIARERNYSDEVE